MNGITSNLTVFQVVPPCGGHPVLLREGIDPLAFQVVPPCGGHRGSCRPPPWVLPFQVVPPCGGHLVKAACLASGPGVSSRAPVWGASWPGWRPSGRPISFKSCPRVGGIITKDYHQLWGWRCFKSCPRVGGIGSYWQQCISGVRFKSCPRVGGIAAFAPLWQTTEVSSRAPVWGASAVESGSSVREKFQVVPPCGGHPRSRSASGSRAVSSRAPVWGASAEIHRWGWVQNVSSRAPVWGASNPSAERMAIETFQVVPPCGGHHLFVGSAVRLSAVSSRAPVWGASLTSAPGRSGRRLFQVVPPCGGHHPPWIGSI